MLLFIAVVGIIWALSLASDFRQAPRDSLRPEIGARCRKVCVGVLVTLAVRVLFSFGSALRAKEAGSPGAVEWLVLSSWAAALVPVVLIALTLRAEKRLGLQERQ